MIRLRPRGTSPMTFGRYYILVDYDNFAKNVLGGKGRPSINAMFDTVRLLHSSSSFFEGASPKSNVIFRLYGGWFYNRTQTRDAERLIMEIREQPSGTYYLNADTPLYVDFELAKAMLTMNREPFAATYRKNLFDRCPKCGSPKQGVDVRQKLVDTMLCCDFIHLSSQDEHVAVVTNDDDLVPPLFQQASLGKSVYHVLTTREPSSSFSSFYDPIHPTGYHCIPRD